MLGASASALLLASLPTPASAHGSTTLPGARTYLCYLDLQENSSTQMPANPACADAVAQSGTGPLYNWFAVLDSNGAGRTEGYIPDGELCSGGNNGPFDFGAYDAARTDWPTTHLTSGSNIELKHSNWAHHPGEFNVYITNENWSSGQPLGWGDLEQISTVTNPPQRGGVGTEDGHYYWDVQLPERSGEHIIYVHWIRSDSQENFYSCSDVVFDGGNGEVTFGNGNELSADQVAAAYDEAATEAMQASHALHNEHAGHGAEAQTSAVTSVSQQAVSLVRAVGSDLAGFLS
ncbi:lytic polysaccharide monooxygenase [Streptomyces sp. DSM 44915]|uniref:Lytic polysaccharide monooxygenase n=1 Tax=Streptomyces chisholmiae TaxID=3075540 RepID=A0ABU2JNS9_9ACTN|nr:lytic polysaccharide monooxygenase [Streptomyces sp. DSM 44915]MDT0266651.1 lytic polysaccharide monooxygenase [Streptomyces sp. DSM 44915]